MMNILWINHMENERVSNNIQTLLQKTRRATPIPGCSAEYGFYEEFQENLNVPVLDAVTSPFKYIELIAVLSGFDWIHSKIGRYESPSVAETEGWYIENDYENADVWMEGDSA